LILLSVVIALLAGSLPASAKDWGLGFEKDGQKPRGDETAQYLRQFDAWYAAPGDEKVIYLTFDAGYENGYTERILDVLKKENVPATFFLVGTYIRTNPDLAKRIVADGHNIGNHTTRHPDMSAMDSARFEKELKETEAAYTSVIGGEMKKFYRPPSGKYSEQNLRQAQTLGYKTIFWSLAYKDYDNNSQPSREAAFSKLIPRIHSGAIVLLHATSKTTSEILEELIGRYRAMGYEFGRLDELT